MASIDIESVRKEFDRDHVAVRDVSLHIDDGELLCLVGPSGCGKSTLLNLVAGLDSVTSGTIRIDGVDVTNRAPGERDIAMVFQSYALYPHMTVRRNMAFPLEVARMPARERDARVNETAERLGLTSMLDRKPSQLSGGQRQRVALGRALVRKPKVFLLDEPLSNLDAALRSRMRVELKKLHQSLGGTFVYVTHDQAEAMTLADRVVVLSAGAIQQVGSPREVYDRPANRFVAEFFGHPSMQIVAPSVLGLATPSDAEVVVGMRPEQLRLDVPEPSVLGRVDLVEPMGSEAWVTIAIGDARIVARTPPDFAGRIGDTVSVSVRGALTYFDATSGVRVDAA